MIAPFDHSVSLVSFATRISFLSCAGYVLFLVVGSCAQRFTLVEFIVLIGAFLLVLNANVISSYVCQIGWYIVATIKLYDVANLLKLQTPAGRN